MITIKLTKNDKDGEPITERKSFINKKDMYDYILFDMLDTYLEQAREDLDRDDFMDLCLDICGFMEEYFNFT